MITNLEPPSEKILRRVSAVAALLAIAIATATLIGWMFEIPALRYIHPEFGAMHPNAAIGLIAAGISLLLQRTDSSESKKRLAWLLGAILLLIGMYVVGEYIIGHQRNLRLAMLHELILYRSPEFGWMSVITAVCFVIFGTALLRFGTKVGQILSLTTMLIAYSSLDGYIFGDYWIILLRESPPMPVSTAIAILLLSSGYLLARPGFGIMQVVTSDMAGGRSLRFMLPAIVLLPILLEWVEERSGVFGSQGGSVMIIIVLTSGFGVLLYMNARLLNRSEELQTSRGRVLGILNAAMDGVISTNEHQDIIFVNPAAERIFGYAAADLLGKPVETLLPLEKREAHRQHIRYFGATGVSARTMYALGEIRGLHAEGHEIPLEATISQATVEDEKIYTVIMRDVTERKQSENDLQRLAAIVDSTADAIIGKTLDGIIISWNKGAEKIYGYTKEEIIGQSVGILIPPDMPDELGSILAKMRRGESIIQYRTRRRHRSGTILIISLTISPVKDGRGNNIGFSTIARDVSNHVQTEENLRISEERYRSLFENMVEGYAYCSVLYDNGKPVDFVYMAVNAAFWAITGLKDVIGKKASEVIPDIHEVNPEMLEIYSRVAETGVPTQFEGYVDGLKIWVSVSVYCPSPGHFVAVFDDITERKQAEKKILASEMRYRRLFEAAKDGILILHAETGKIEDVNPFLVDMLGYGKAEFIGKELWEIGLFKDIVANKTAFLKLQQERYVRYEHLPLRTKGGRAIWVEFVSNVYDVEGKQVIQCNIRDITEQKRIEQQMQRAQRLESIGTLAGGIAHDLNNILTPIMLSLEVLGRKFPDPQTSKLLDMLKGSVMRGSDMIRQVLGFARGVEGERSAVQLRHIIAEIGKIIHETFLKSITLRVDIQKDLPAVLADATQIHQVLMNLCVNARDAMPHGGTLEIKAEAITLDEQYARMQINAKPGSYVVISVTDQGTGMPPAVLEKIFEPFYTTKEVGKGTGLGLSTVLAITQSHGGFINVYSEVGKGTTFKVYLPIALTEELAEKQEEQQTAGGNGELILLVDDEANILAITKQTLEDKGYAVITATDGAEAVGIYASHKEAIALVVTDMVMPFMDGTATIRALQKMNPAVRIIAVSGLKRNSGHLLEDGVTFLSKPYTSERLLATIHQALSAS